MSVHPTAIIHPDAQLAADVEVGPYVCIEGPSHIGPGCVLKAHAVLAGTVMMGEKNIIGHGAIIGGASQHLAFSHDHPGQVIIGNENTIRELATINRSTVEGGATRIGDNNFLMGGVHLGHDVHLGSRIVIANNALLGGHVEIADQVFIGGGSVFHQHVRVGRLAIAQGASGFSKDVPPFTVGAERNSVAGINAIGLRRAGLNPAQRREIKEAFRLLYRSGLNTAQALQASAELEWGVEGREFFDFVQAATKRGICDLLERGRFYEDD